MAKFPKKATRYRRNPLSPKASAQVRAALFPLKRVTPAVKLLVQAIAEPISFQFDL
jgi:hypothetical protein